VKWKDYWDCPEEIIICGILSCIPIYWIIGWWVLPMMAVNGLLWRWGGATGGWIPARWALVPLIVCGATFIALSNWTIFLAAPFMDYLSPFGYGKESWLYKWLKSDFLTRLICWAWYWFIFSIAYCF
jgi:hypothetical protein